MKTLRLILGDQLNPEHPWFRQPGEGVVYLMAELRQETDYVVHHIQKVVAFFAAMRAFAGALEQQGYQVRYFRIGDPDNPQSLAGVVRQVAEEENIGRFEYQLPDEYRLDQQLQALCTSLAIPCQAFDTAHFYTSRGELKEFFRGKKQYLMESFYRRMRKKHGVLMEGGQPLGGQWNFDRENRKAWKGKPAIPPGLPLNKDVSPLVAEIRQAGVKTLGTIDPAHFQWTTTPGEALELLDYFCRHLLPHFGDYQDAMHSGEKFLFHSRLSFALNAKLISPRRVVETVEAYFRAHRDRIHLSQAEGFIRQVLGWREYMRGIYWMEMPGYRDKNALNNQNPLPEFFWTGQTRMKCLSHTIGQSLEEAYAHHIQRLMVTGNFALLAQVQPDEVDRWYLGIYADAVEWVQLPNTRGMSQFADGGLVATKPYVSSANYLQKMGNYCQGCPYDPQEKTGPTGCPFNALYWNFLDEKRETLSQNPRMGMMYRLLDQKVDGELAALKARAADIIAHPERF
ncbi:cryptochrome/photolyase family protein [Robiginitalea marina]|uniref:Cryptochrome/photolyase family protein n=1 Tax=Robiginitalea marina TaxID=2954105 RepID=A0ABT1AXX5_9FLAO|nr:cryptochrome/photolyase family protein [Robiginitalea marina]MCO5724836.1 cryptochrome/photolyase family protein [Robiginitalea marina]